MGKFRCGSSGCISMSAQCDGHVDCEHGEDELSCGKKISIHYCS